MTCPKCGFEEWKMASVVYAEGLNGEQQTKLSQMAAPPSKKIRQSKALSILGLSGIALSVIIYILIKKFVFFLNVPGYLSLLDYLFVPSGILFLAGLIWYFLTPNINREINEQYKKALLSYNNVKMCLRCGKFFLDEQQKTMGSESTSPEDIKVPQAKINLEQQSTSYKLNKWSKKQNERNRRQWRMIGNFFSSNYKKILSKWKP